MKTTWPVLMMALTAVACGDDDGSGPNVPDLTRADVAGIYEMSRLTFDPNGSAFAQVDVLDRLDANDLPELRVSPTKDSLQLVFTDPQDILQRDVPGSYTLGDDRITIHLSNSAEPAKLLLPQNFALRFDETTETLLFDGAVEADTSHLFFLVPEWSGNPVDDPLPGTLGVTFQRN